MPLIVISVEPLVPLDLTETTFPSGIPRVPTVRSNAFRDRLIQHLQRRSQRPYRRPEGEQWLQHLARLGLIRLSGAAHV